ncbi:MAG: DNA alkylation repair protein [Actinomycetota bacterium]|nr:DNA alkylation repair protein [Actinomycetota bacterium]
MIAELQAELERRADPDRKAWWEGYVKGSAFRGVPMGEIRAVVRAWMDGRSPEEARAAAFDLMREPLSDDKLAGILILSEHLLGGLGPADLPAFRELLADEHLGGWNNCDWFCVKVLGRMLARSPERERIADELTGWTRSDDLWVRRAGLVAFVNLAPRGDEALPGLTGRVLTGAERNAADPRRFAQTSVGWTLRELSKAEPEAVARFLEEHGERLSAEARRAAGAKLPAALG